MTIMMLIMMLLLQVLHDPGRGALHQELPEPAVADAADVQHPAAAAADGDAPPEQHDGAVVAHALPDAVPLPVPSGVQDLVCDAPDGARGGRPGGGHVAGHAPARRPATLHPAPS